MPYRDCPRCGTPYFYGENEDRCSNCVLHAYDWIWKAVALVLWLVAVLTAKNATVKYVTWLSEASNPVKAIEMRLAVEKLAAEVFEARYLAEHQKPEEAEGTADRQGIKIGPFDAGRDSWLNAHLAYLGMYDSHRLWLQELQEGKEALQPTTRLVELVGSIDGLALWLYGPGAYRARTTQFALSFLVAILLAVGGVVGWRRAK